jgi:pseudouridine-5'-phosphate glycosidase
VDTPEQAARIISAAQQLEAQHGMLFVVPVPELHEMPSESAEAAITQATAEAEAQGIHGKAVTPYVLARVAELTGGESRSANTALLINNARVAGKIACALVKL